MARKKQTYPVVLRCAVGGRYGGKAGDTVHAPADLCRAWLQTGIIGELPTGAVRGFSAVEYAAERTSTPRVFPADVETREGGGNNAAE